MAEKSIITKPVAAAVGVAFVSSMAVSTSAVAADNPFEATDLDEGYMLAGEHKGEDCLLYTSDAADDAMNV